MEQQKCNHCNGTGVLAIVKFFNKKLKCQYCNGTGRKEKEK